MTPPDRPDGSPKLVPTRQKGYSPHMGQQNLKEVLIKNKLNKRSRGTIIVQNHPDFPSFSGGKQ